MRRAGALIAAAFALAGCNGGTIDRKDLQADGKTLDSIACEGALVAEGVARGRTTVYFAREQAEELWLQSSNFADAFRRRPVSPGNERATTRAADRAQKLADTLLRLHDHPSDTGVASAVEQTLKSDGSCP